MTTSEGHDWHVVGGELRLQLPDGNVVRPTNAEVVGAEYKGRLSVRGQVVSRTPTEALPSISFSRFPAEVVVRVTPPSADLSTPPVCRLTLERDGKLLDALVPDDPSTDQVLAGQQWIPVVQDSMEVAAKCLARFGISRVGPLTLRQYVGLRGVRSEMIRFDDPPLPTPNGSRAPECSLPGTFQATLYPYQADGVRWLSYIAAEGLGCLLGDEMGLGKTLQVIALLARETAGGRVPALVIAPATLIENWRRELARFAPSLRAAIHRGQGRTGFPSLLRSHDVVLTTYDTAMRDLPLLKMIEWNVVILDEAQAIKTPDAQRTAAVKAIPRRIAIAVTGTPVENRLRDLWSIMDFAVPGFLGVLSDFERSYTDSIADASRLEPIVTPLLLRRLVANVAADLPPRIDIPHPIELSNEAAAEYDAIRQDIAAEYGSAATLVSVTKLRLFCTHPFLLSGVRGDPREHSTKYARLMELLEEIIAGGEKTLIFTSFTEMTDILVADIARRFGIPCGFIDGRTLVQDRQPTVDDFQNTVGTAVLVLNPKAAGVGLNITAASHVIHYNLEWNPAVEDQATARAYRRGQTKPVTVHRLFHANTIEEVIDQRLTRKRVLAGEAVIGVQGAEDDVADILKAIELSPVFQDKNNYGV